MSSFTPKTLLSALVGATAVAAHGHVQTITIDGEILPGYDIFSFPWITPEPETIGWKNTVEDNGFILPSDFQNPDIICHKGATNAPIHATVAPGSSLVMQWDTWPESHEGPVIDYLARCDGECETVDKTSLEFFKIAEMGMISPAIVSGTPGRFATDILMEQGNAWTIDIPEGLAPGNYILRHEIIALHEGQNDNGAQHYPQCINIEITGSGTDVPAGVPGMELYQRDDAGVHFNIYDPKNTVYPIPGPAVYTRGTGGVFKEVEEEEVVEEVVVPEVEDDEEEEVQEEVVVPDVAEEEEEEVEESAPAAPTATAAPVVSEPEEPAETVTATPCPHGRGRGRHGRHGRGRHYSRRHARDVGSA